MDPILTYAIIQTLGAAVSASINAYLNAPPRPSFQPDSGQETLFDEENWARVLDIQEILCLVQPLISAMQNLDIAPLLQAAREVPRDHGRRLDEANDDLPPPYTTQPDDPESYYKEYAYRIMRKTQRLVETLKVAAGGPSASSGIAWNLHVTASNELGLEVLEMYRVIIRTMSGSPSGSFLALVWEAVRLYDADLLDKVNTLFQPVQFRHPENSADQPTYSLRLPTTKRSLSITKPEKQGFTLGAAQLAEIVLLFSYPGPVWAFRYFCPKESIPPITVSKAGNCGSNLSFLPLVKSPAPGANKENASPDEVCFGSQVNIACFESRVCHRLKASDGKGSPATCRILHHDDRYKSQPSGRVVNIRDRVILKEEASGKLLSRKRVGDDDWEVGFGISDDILWTIALPM
ncbi:hypothetical protein EK21DRAFT_89056 [Setomelanomma holmii]|uniref:Uncharacterized protein n=1 Tax=Setomelanomma holmii TaxID=210430 RepID=A0A9P4HBI6_9PLEO|nr:hypothetical protein EK21DRAFT_89056 [Setomelanomma holmii]